MAALITLNDILMTSYVCYVASLLFSLSSCGAFVIKCISLTTYAKLKSKMQTG